MSPISIPGKVTLQNLSLIVVSDPDATAYLQAVEAADKQKLESGVVQAVNNFVIGCKADGTWSAIKASCILAGARTLAGALIPLVGTAPTNNNFVSGDYNRKTGLVGNASTKRLDSNYAFPAALRNNCHITTFASVNDTTGIPVGYTDSTNNGSYISSRSARLYQFSSSTFIPTDTTTTGFRGISRASSASFVYRRAGANETASIVSQSVTHEQFAVFARRRPSSVFDGYADGRLSFYSIGESLDLALLDARVTTLMSDIGAAIP